MTKKRPRSPGWGLLIAAAMLAGMLAGMTLLVRPWQQSFLKRYWFEKLASAERTALPEIVETIAAFRDVGLPTLIAGLKSDRQPVVDECYRQVRLLMDHWSLLPREEATDKLAQCARLLGSEADCRGPAARGLAADLARRLLWIADEAFPPQRRLALVQHCETVMELEPAAFEGPSTPDIRLAAFEQDADADHVSPNGPLPGTISLPTTASNAATTPTPPTPDPVPTNPDPVRVPWQRPYAAGPGDATAPAESPHTVRAPNMIDVDPRARRLAKNIPFSTPKPGRPEAPSFDSQSVGVGGEPEGDLSENSDVPGLMRQLHSRRQGVSDHAEAELRHRGLTAAHIALARRLTDPRPSERLALVDELPSSAGIDSRQWLLWLTRDHDADVRLAALTVMATSGDPMLLRQVESIAREDSDPRIVALAERVLKQVRSPSTR